MKKLIFFISLSLLILVGCEKEYERTIWVNPDVECCGVKDPLNNLEWLTDWWNRRISYFQDSEGYLYFLLYKNKNTFEDIILYYDKKEGYNKYVYACSCSEKLFNGSLPAEYNDPTTKLNTKQYTLVPPPPDSPPISFDMWNNFLNENTLIDTIAYYIVN